jgi:hypothetical protein
VKELADELKHDSESSQPVIDEEHFPKTGKIRVNVLWDKWDKVPHEKRPDVILKAYETAEGEKVRENIVLAVGLTFPEAYESGMLPFQVIPVLRKGDKVSAEDCLSAMRAEGASELFPNGKPELRFTTREAAEASVRRLSERLPGSEPVWVILQEVGRIETVGDDEVYVPQRST